MSNINQMTLVRKDVIGVTKKIFREDMNLDFLLLQYFVGYLFYLYELKIKNTNIYSGFYSSTQKNIFERFNLIKNRKITYFSINYLNEKYIPYYLHACLVNMGLIEKNVKNIYFVMDKNKYKYFIPLIERSLREKVEFNIISVEKLNTIQGKFGENLLIFFDDSDNKMEEVKHLSILIENINSIEDLLFFINLESKTPSFNLKVKYPKNMMYKLDEKFKVPISKILNVDNEDSGVRICKIITNKN